MDWRSQKDTYERSGSGQFHTVLAYDSASAARLYWLGECGFDDDRQNCGPDSHNGIPNEVYKAPETWARRAYRNLIYFHEAARRGHFAAWEYPGLFAAEMRAAFKTLR